MPRGVVLDKDTFDPGDELLLTGVSGFFFPFNEIEVLSPRTGEAVVGNDHSDVFIEAIGIDQKSGIYVRDLTTGEVRLIRGKQSYLVDPRKEIHITRTISAADWNLWIAPSEPHKQTGQAMTTPWAVSVIVPHNTAVLATSAAAQRIIEGPCVTLLEYEETLVPLRLSTGTPKSDDDVLMTCFLRTVGNRVSDIIDIETSDFVRIRVRTSYTVTYRREERDRWFNCENYIQVMCDHLRSIVRSRTRTLSLSHLWPEISTVVRDTILGPRGEGGEGRRKGRAFDENGMLVTEVEVLEASIEDEAIAEMMQAVQRESVTLTIGDRRAQETLASAKLRADLERQTLELQAAAREREARLKETLRKVEHESRIGELREKEAIQREQLELVNQRELLGAKSRIEREGLVLTAQLEGLGKDARARAEAARLLHAEEIEHQTTLRQLELALIEAHSRAQVAERTAIQPKLVEALTALGDKALLSEVAQNMNLISLFRGKDAGAILAEIFGGTRFLPALNQALGRSDKE
jgi:major vault protein